MRVVLTCVAVALAGCGTCADNDREVPRAEPEPEAGPPPAVRLAIPPLATAPAAPAPKESIGRGVRPSYPTPVPLTLADGLEPLDPPMRVVRVMAIEGRPLAVVSGIAAAGPTVELIDIDRGVILWRDTSCGAPAVHTTGDRIVCAGWQGIRGLSVDDGRTLWTSQLMFRAAHERYLIARDPEDDKTAAILDVQSGELVMQLLAPPGETFDEAKHLCPADKQFEVYSWSLAGVMRQLKFARIKNAPSTGRVGWRRKLARPPAKVDLCDPIPLFEIPEPGSIERELHAVSAKTGNDLVPAIAVRGWWRAPSGDGIETSTDTGIQKRTRKLDATGVLLANPVAGRLVAQSGSLRLVRSVAQTLVLVDDDGLRAWMAAPARVDRAVMSGQRLLAGSWLSPPQTAADHALLYELPPRVGLPEPPPPVARGPSQIPEPPPQRVPARPTWKPRAYQKSGVGTHAVTLVDLDGETVFAVALEGRPSPKRGAGIAAFDLAARSWTWHNPAACPHNATVVGLDAAAPVVVCAAYEHYPGRGHVWATDRKTGADAWHAELPTIDGVVAGGGAVVALVGDRAVVLDAATGKVVYEVQSDNGHQARVAIATTADRTLVIAVEPGGVLVARDPAAGGEVVWARAVNGYVTHMVGHSAGVGVELATGELLVVDGAGVATALPAWSSEWELPAGSDLVVDEPVGTEGVTVLRAFDAAGGERFRTALAITPPLSLAGLRSPGAPLLFLSHRGDGRLIVLSPGPGGAAGRVQASYHVPEGFVRGGFFTAVAGGKPVVGAVLAKPLAVALF